MIKCTQCTFKMAIDVAPLLHTAHTCKYPQKSTRTNGCWCTHRLHRLQTCQRHRDCWMAPRVRRSGLPAKVPLLRHSLMRLALRTWKALVISWFMKLSLLRTFATIILRSNTSSSSAMVATCIRSPRPSSRLPVYRYWSTAWNQSVAALH